MKSRKQKAVFSLLMVLLIIMLISTLFGAASITPRKIVFSIMNKVLGVFTQDVTVETIIWDIRVPRIILAAVVGLLLSVSGVILQGILRN